MLGIPNLNLCLALYHDSISHGAPELRVLALLSSIEALIEIYHQIRDSRDDSNVKTRLEIMNIGLGGLPSRI